MKWLQRFLWVVVWGVFLAMPIVFLFAASGADLGADPLGGLYRTMVTVLGEKLARIVFVALWLAFGIVLFRRRRPKEKGADDDAPYADLHD
jgi:H+/Cl- antiporter ClcA